MIKKIHLQAMLLALLALSVPSTQLEAGFGGLFKAARLGGSGSSSSYDDQEAARIEAEREAQRKAEEERQAAQMRKYFAIGSIILLVGGGTYYIRSRRRKKELEQYTQSVVRPEHTPKAQVLFYDTGKQIGKITTSQGKRHEFKAENVLSGLAELKAGVEVDFIEGDDGTATDIRVSGTYDETPVVEIKHEPEIQQNEKPKEYVEIIPFYKKYLKHLIIATPIILIIVVIAVWFFVFRTVTVYSGETSFRMGGGLDVRGNPYRQNFIVRREIPFYIKLPNELLQYVEEADGKRLTLLHIRGHKQEKGLAMGNKQSLLSLYSDDTHRTEYVFDINGQLVTKIPVSGAKYHGSGEVYDQQGKLIKTVKFFNGKGESKQFYPNGELAVIERYDSFCTPGDCVNTRTVFDENGSLIEEKAFGREWEDHKVLLKNYYQIGTK